MWPASDQPLRLALIGMSGVGKSHWSLNLGALGYPVLSCDDRIERRLAPLLESGGYTGIQGVAAWMGWPDSATYAEREATYLREEIAVLDEALSSLERDPEHPLVLDTTGSVIYAGTNLLLRLRRRMKVVYLKASGDELQLLTTRYLEDPKPVLWRGAFKPRPGETATDTVERCYPVLIAARRQGYEALAHVSLPTTLLRELSPPGTSRNALAGRALLERMAQLLPHHP